jgi:hypothetical protein
MPEPIPTASAPAPAPPPPPPPSIAPAAPVRHVPAPHASFVPRAPRAPQGTKKWQNLIPTKGFRREGDAVARCP